MGNLTEFRLHRAAPLSDSGILSSPSIKTSPLVTSYPRNVIFSQHLISILSKVSPLVDNLFLLSIKTSLPPRQRETHQQESSFRIPIRSRPWFVDPNTWKGYNSTHVNSGRESVLTETQGVSPPQAVLSSSNWQRIFAQERVDPGRVHH